MRSNFRENFIEKNYILIMTNSNIMLIKSFGITGE